MGRFDNDSDLEQQARRQAELIFDAIGAAHAAPATMSSLFQKIGIGATPSRAVPIPEPGCELLLWRLRSETKLDRAMQLAARLLAHPSFMANLPSDRDCPILVYQARRKWNEAAAAWATLGDPKATTWLRCDRRLLLRHTPKAAQLIVERNDLEVHHDPTEQKLVPVRHQNTRPVQPSDSAQLVDWFPNLTLKLFVDGMRAPTRLLSGQGHSSRGHADAYVHNAPLFVNDMGIFMQEKVKPKEEKEDPNKGFVTWLSNTLRAANNK
jgi:hypothetical protein